MAFPERLCVGGGILSAVLWGYQTSLVDLVAAAEQDEPNDAGKSRD